MKLHPIISAQADTFVGRILQRVVIYGQAKPARSFVMAIRLCSLSS